MSPPAGSEAALRRDWWCFLIDDADLPVSSSHPIDVHGLDPVSWLDPADEVAVVRALLMRGHPDVAARYVDRADARASRRDAHPLATTLHDHLVGLAAWDRAPLERACAGWEGLRRPLVQAAAWSDLGVKLLELGDERGLQLMLDSHERLVGLGAHRDAWRVRWALRAKGHVLAPDRDRSRDLTPGETRVVERAISGATVSEIAAALGLSRHTVSTHLRHVYTKLDIRSRAELTAWAQEN